MLEIIHSSWFPMEENLVDVKKMNAIQDVSSFLLFEASGDSEAPAAAEDHSYNDSDDHPALAMDEDDAQSCSYGSTYHVHSPNDDQLIDDDLDHDHVDVDYHDDHEEEDEEEEEYSSVYHQTWGGHDQHDNIGMPLMGHQMKSTVSVDSTKEFELLNEVEKSRLFWETCLAS